MKIQKVFIKTAYCLIGLSILVLIVLTIFQYHQIKKISENAARETVTEDESAGEAIPGPVEDLKERDARDTTPSNKEIDELEYQLEASEEELNMAHDQLSEEQGKRATDRESARQLYKRALDDPASEKMLRTTFKGVLDINYGPLFEELNLSPEKQDEFSNILIDQQMATLDISREMLYDSPSEENKRELKQRFQEFREEYEKKISECLGPGDYITYEAYQERLPERILVNNFMELLNPDDRLSADQEKGLVDSMYEQKKDLYSELGYDPEELVFPSEMDKEKMARNMERLDRTYARYTESAGMTLNESQMEQFRKYLGQQRDMEESSLEMLRQMNGS